MTNEIVLYQPNDQLSIEVKLENETVWLTQQQMAMLFNTTRNNITLHIGNIFREGELDKDSVCKESLLTAADGKVYKTNFYNLDVIISVGYRVKSITRHYDGDYDVFCNRIQNTTTIRVIFPKYNAHE